MSWKSKLNVLKPSIFSICISNFLTSSRLGFLIKSSVLTAIVTISIVVVVTSVVISSITSIPLAVVAIVPIPLIPIVAVPLVPVLTRACNKTCQNSELQQTCFHSSKPLTFQYYGSTSLPPPLPRALPTNPPRLPHCCCWYCSFDMATFISHWKGKFKSDPISKDNPHKPFLILQNTKQKIWFGHSGALPEKKWIAYTLQLQNIGKTLVL